MIYHAKVFEKIETVTKIKYGEKMRDMKKINKANMCIELRYNLLSRNTSFDVNMWNLSITYLYSIMASHVVPMCLIINHIRYMTDLVRISKICSFGFQSTASSSPNHGKKESTSSK